jgi:hypothetical protein
MWYGHPPSSYVVSSWSGLRFLNLIADAANPMTSKKPKQQQEESSRLTLKTDADVNELLDLL